MRVRAPNSRFLRQATRLVVAAGLGLGVFSCKDVTGPLMPETPAGIAVVLLSPTSAKVTWLPSSDPSSIRSFNVFRNGTKVGEVNVPVFVDTGLSELVTYKYAVSANGTNGLVSAVSVDTPGAAITPPDVTPPTVVLTSPSASATGVDRSAKITATFSEPIDPATAIGANFIVRTAGRDPISGTVAYSAATKTIEFTPVAAYPNSAVVSVTITTGIRDVTGNAMASQVAFSFTTRDDIPPGVISTTIPATGDVPLSQVISATMNEAIDPSSLTSTTVRLTSGPSAAPVEGTISYDSPSHTITFTPTSGLASATDYVFNVGPGVKDVTGNASTSGFSKSFRTVDATPPSVTSVAPANGASNVSVATTVRIVFSKAMNPSTVNASTISLSGAGIGAVSGAINYDPSSTSLTFSPTSALQNGIAYTITVSTGAADAAGNSLAAPFTSTFTTSAAAPPPDITPPSVVSSTPVNGSTGVSITTPISITFSEPLLPATVSSSTIFLSGPGGATVSGTVSYDNSSLSAVFTPAASLQNGTSYTLNATTGVKDVAGNSLQSTFAATFTTVVALPPPDTTPPTVLSTQPPNGSVSVPVTTPIRVTFSESMDAGTINTTTVTLSVVGVTISGSVSYDAGSRTASFVPSAGLLAENQTYTLTVTTGARDAAGNPLAANFVASFQTEDLTRPTITSRSPAPGSTGVATSAAIQIGFSEAMKASTISGSTVTVSANGTPVSGSVTYNASTHVATFTPSSALANFQSYSVTVTTGVQDLAGNALASNDTFSFTTVPAPPAFDISGVTGALGWWQTTTAGAVGIHFHIVFDQSGSTLSRSSTCSSGGQDSCITLAQNQAGQDAVGPNSPSFVWVLTTSASGVMSGTRIVFTLTNANGRSFTFDGAVSSPYSMTGTISGATLPAETVTFTRPTP